MSLIISAITKSGVQMLTDAAFIDAQSCLQRVDRKVVVAPSSHLVASVRGVEWLSDIMLQLVRAAGAFGSFDVALAEIESAMMENKPSIEKAGGKFELVVSGISESRGPSHFHMASQAYGWHAAWKMERETNGCVFLGGRYDAASSGVSEPELIEAGDDALRKYGVLIVDAMRRDSVNARHIDRPGHCVIGGWLDLATVTTDGAKVERLHKYPDAIGEIMRP